MMTAVTEMFELYSDTYYQELLLQAASLAGRISTKIWNHILCGIKKTEKVLNLTLWTCRNRMFGLIRERQQTKFDWLKITLQPFW